MTSRKTKSSKARETTPEARRVAATHVAVEEAIRLRKTARGTWESVVARNRMRFGAW